MPIAIETVRGERPGDRDRRPRGCTTDSQNQQPVSYVSGPVPVITQAKEGFIMDPHFAEYLAAVAGMHDTYGEPHCDGTSEFHDEPVATAATEPVVPAAA
jgi:hypothetical protein